MKRAAGQKKSNIGMTLSFTQVCVGDKIKVGCVGWIVLQKSLAEHYIFVSELGQTHLPSRRIYEFEFNQLKPILMEEGK